MKSHAAAASRPARAKSAVDPPGKSLQKVILRRWRPVRQTFGKGHLLEEWPEWQNSNLRPERTGQITTPRTFNDLALLSTIRDRQKIGRFAVPRAECVQGQVWLAPSPARPLARIPSGVAGRHEHLAAWPSSKNTLKSCGRSSNETANPIDAAGVSTIAVRRPAWTAPSEAKRNRLRRNPPPDRDGWTGRRDGRLLVEHR